MASPTTSFSPTSPPLHLTIRFSTSLPDLDLDIPSPHRTSVLALKLLLRTRLDTRARLRLIHQGRILPDAAALTTIHTPHFHPLPASKPRCDSTQSFPNDSQAPTSLDTHHNTPYDFYQNTPYDAHQTSPHDAKGKRAAIPAPRVYLNCAIGPDLDAPALAAEQAAALAPPSPTSSTPRPAPPPVRPRGFDRFRTAGFSSSEIATLRTQFASVYAHRFPPDAPPSPDSLRRMEDSWIDSNAADVPSTSSAGASTDDVSSMSSVLDVLIRGMMIGFFFPLGSLTWLLRAGIWSDKWRIFVGSGVILSILVGIIMTLSGNR